MRSFRSSRRFVKAALPLALVALLAACGGGGGGASPAPPAGGTPTVAPTATAVPSGGSTPKPTPFPTSTATVAPGGSSPLTGPTYSPTQTVPLNQSWGPNDVANALHFPVQSGYNGGGITVAVVIDSYVLMSDVNAFLSYYQIPSTSRTITGVAVAGASLTPGADQDEATLDVETIAALAPGANILVYVVPDLTTTNLNNAFNRIFANRTAQVVSLSASGCESASSVNTSIFAEGANNGIAFLTASGDTGNECYVDTVDTVPVYQVGVGYPASDPSVIAVGGNETANASGPTSLTSSTVWNDTLTADHSQEASGGGVSTLFTPPPYQTGLAGLSSINGAAGRNVPDVSMPAADTAIYLNGQWDLVNGTSWGTPQFAAMLAEIYQYCNTTSIASPQSLPYTAFSRTPGAFVDVVSGNNQYKSSTPFYTAGSGYDAASGLGVPLGVPFSQSVCPNRVLSSAARTALSVAEPVRHAADAYQMNVAPSVAGLVDSGRRDSNAQTAIQLVLLPSSSASDEAAVTAALQGAGLTITQTFSNHRLVDASGPSSAVEQLFGTQLHDVTQGQYGTRYLPVGPATIPASLAPYLSGVVLDNVIVAHAGPLHRR